MSYNQQSQANYRATETNKKLVVYIWKRVTEDDVVESICTFVCWLFSLNLCHLWPPPEKKQATATVAAAAQHEKQATAIH